MPLKLYENEEGTLAKRITPGKENDLGVRTLYSAVFEPNNGTLVGVIIPIREIIAGETPRQGSARPFRGVQVYKWSVINGVFKKSDIVLNIPTGKYPREVALVVIDNKPTLVLSTSNLPHNIQATDGTPVLEIWETNFLNGGTELTTQLHTSTVLTHDTARLHLKSWDNMLFVRSTNRYGRKNALHVYVDLKYKSKLAVPWDDSNVEITSTREDVSTPRILNVSFSDKYVSVNIRINGYRSTAISVYTWSPNKLTVGDLVFGPERASEHGYNALLSSSLILTAIDGIHPREDFQVLGIYDVENNSCNRIKYKESETFLWLRTFVKVNAKHILLLDGNGETFELTY